MESIKKYNIYGVNGKYESDYGRNIDHKNITPEQALRDLREDVKRHFFEQRQHLNKRLDIIETTLKEYEGAKKHIKALNKERVENSIKIKALEIIKEKKVDVGLLIRCLNAYCIDSAYQEYNQWTQEEHLTYEECVLLKEMLL